MTNCRRHAPFPNRSASAAIVTECMESAAALKVRLVVDYGVGDNWLEAH